MEFLCLQFRFVYGERYNVVSVSAGVIGCSSAVHGFCCSNITAVILIVASFVLVILLVNFPPTDFMCKARRMDCVWESCYRLVSVQIILIHREHKKEHQLLTYGSALSEIK